MINVVLLGYGNVGRHLYTIMEATETVQVLQVYNRNYIDGLATPQTQSVSNLLAADVYIIAIPDDAIESFSEALPLQGSLVVHTSGGVGITALSANNRRGIFYPLQTFSKNTKVDFSVVPVCIEAENPTDEALLKKLGHGISQTVVNLSSEEREKLHVAAVFVNNFTNHLYQIAEVLTTENGIDFKLLHPLIAETARKMEHSNPSEVQTGPAKRNDIKTIEKHLKLLEGSQFQPLYKALTHSIQHGKKL